MSNFVKGSAPCNVIDKTARSYFVFISFRAEHCVSQTSDGQYLEEGIWKGGIFLLANDLSQHNRT